MGNSNKEKNDKQGMSEMTFRNYLFLISFAICLFIALSNINYLVGYLGVFMNIITPVLIGLGISFVLNIPMSFIETHFLTFIEKFKSKNKKNKDLSKTKRVIAITITFVAMLGIIATIITFIVPQVSESVNTLIDKLPGYIDSFNTLVDQGLVLFGLPATLWNDLTIQWDALWNQFGGMVINSVPEIFNVTKSVTTGIVNIVMGIVISIYLLADKEKLLALKDKLIYAYIRKDRADFIQDVSITANQVFHGFIAGQLTEAFILGTLCTIGLAIMQIPYALLIGVLVGMTSVIPVFGAFLGAVPSGFILLVVNPFYCLIFVIYIVVLQQIETNIIYPRVVGSSIGLSGLWVLIGMIIGGSLFGILGIILGIPTFAVIYAVFRKITNERIVKKTMSDIE